MTSSSLGSRVRSLCFLTVLLPLVAFAQDRLPKMPRYDRYEKIRQEFFMSVKRGDIAANWAADSNSFGYAYGGKYYKYDVHSLKATESQAPPPPEDRGNQPPRQAPGRGRQFTEVFTADGKKRAFYKDRNVYLSDPDGSNAIPVTTDGSVASRTKYGSASWVYGEELEVREAMWFSPDGKKLAYYRFDESKTPDYYIAMSQVSIQDRLDTEAYPKAGAPNPIVDLFVYDLESKKSTHLDTRFSDPSLGEYAYDVRWSPDGRELLYNRTNRKQNVMEFCAANPDTGTCRVIVREEHPQSWVENHPRIQWLADRPGKPRAFLWISERNGFKNVYEGDISGAPLRAITANQFEVQSIVRADEQAGILYYMGRDGDNPYKLQLHRIKLDGTGDARLTDPSLSHRVEISPNGQFLVDIAENLDTPPSTRLLDENGKVLATLVQSDVSRFNDLGLKKQQRIKFKAADGQTDLYGYLEMPSDFDPAKKYPLLVSLYAGPESGSGQERFQLPNPVTELGFVVAWFDGRGTSGRGKAFADAVYGKLGVVEIDDQAAGVKYVSTLPYIDGSRVGVFGTSYGGYASAMCLLRHPECFNVAVSCSPVTDWRNYDSVYTERYMGLPGSEDNEKGYDAGSAMKYVSNLKGRLFLYYGTADNNVHPSNTLQLVNALQGVGKSFDLTVGPDRGHSAMDQSLQWEYFIDNLILAPKK